MVIRQVHVMIMTFAFHILFIVSQQPYDSGIHNFEIDASLHMSPVEEQIPTSSKFSAGKSKVSSTKFF